MVGLKLLLAISLALMPIISANRMLMAKESCQNPSTDRLTVKDSYQVLQVFGSGYRIFWCNNGEFEYTNAGTPHGDQKAELMSKDGKWTGSMTFRPEDGKPEWKLTNTETDEKLTVIAQQKPQARKPSPSGQSLTHDRRKVESTSGSYDVVVDYVIRSNTTSGPKPNSCTGQIDEIVPFTATYTFVSCTKPAATTPAPKCNSWTQYNGLGEHASHLVHKKDCTNVLVCQDGKKYRFAADKKVNVDKCPEPEHGTVVNTRCNSWTQYNGLGEHASHLVHKKDCTNVLVCQDGKKYRFAADKKVNVDKCPEP